MQSNFWVKKINIGNNFDHNKLIHYRTSDIGHDRCGQLHFQCQWPTEKHLFRISYVWLKIWLSLIKLHESDISPKGMKKLFSAYHYENFSLQIPLYYYKLMFLDIIYYRFTFNPMLLMKSWSQKLLREVHYF